MCTSASGCAEGKEGGGAGEFIFANAIAVAPSGNIDVLQDGVEVNEFSPGGQFIRGFGAGAIDGTKVFQICTALTGCMRGAPAEAPVGFRQAEGVGVDSKGSIYVSDIRQIDVLNDGEAKSGGRAGGAGAFLRLGKLRAGRRPGTATLAATVSGPGRISIRGRGLRAARVLVKRAGSARLPIRLVGRALAALRRTGRVRVRASVVFTPSGGRAVTVRKGLVLKRARRSSPRP